MQYKLIIKDNGSKTLEYIDSKINIILKVTSFLLDSPNLIYSQVSKINELIHSRESFTFNEIGRNGLPIEIKVVSLG